MVTNSVAGGVEKFELAQLPDQRDSLLVYSMYVTIEGVSANEFERFFEVTVREPDPLTIYSGLTNKSNNLTLTMKGGQVYNVTHNGKTTQTSASEITIALDNGNNAIRVDTGLECQGVYQETFFNSSEVQIAPNPFNDAMNLFIGGTDRTNEISGLSNASMKHFCPKLRGFK